MAIIYPDTSQTPLWRLPPTKLEHPIRAWRCWHLRRETQMLKSVAYGVYWEGPVMHAHVKPFDPERWDRERDQDVWSGGIYALNSEELLLKTARAYGASVLGEVELWGRVVRFTHGWRAEWCMIRKLQLQRGRVSPRTAAHALECRYQCDVEWT